MNVTFQNDKLESSSSEVLWVPTSSSSFHGGGDCLDRSFFQPIDKEENVDDGYDGSLHQPGKKRRLTVDQVRFLESNFVVENKLEPERKVQFAKELGLQPRQVAIWFQNRRARFKTKQLEKEYDSLKSSYDELKADHDNLLKENGSLKNEVDSLKEMPLSRQQAKPGKGNLESHSAINSLDVEPQNETPNEASDNVANLAMVVCKQEEASSAKSDVFDLDSPHCTGNHSSLLEPTADSSHVFEQAERSDFSRDEDDTSLCKSLLPSPYLLKLEDTCYDDLPATSSKFGFPVEDQEPFCFWPY